MLTRHTTDGLFKQRPTWAPDGRTLLFARHYGDNIFVHVLDTETGEERRLTERDRPEYDAVFSPDGSRIACTLVRNEGTQGIVEVFTLAPDGGDPQPIRVMGDTLSHAEYPAWSPNGARLAYQSTHEGNPELYIAAADGSDALRLTNDPGLDAHPCFAPDGSQLVFATERWGDLEIAVVDVGGSNLARLTDSRGMDDYPAWSPDGGRIAFVSNRDGNFEVYVMRADGSEPVNVTNDPGIDTFPTWTRDGRGITFVSNRDGGFDIYTLALE